MTSKVVFSISMDIRKIKQFFAVSNAMFDFTDKVAGAFQWPIMSNEMRDLHRAGLLEAEKDYPDEKVLSEILEKIEKEAERLGQKTFPSGGIIHK